MIARTLFPGRGEGRILALGEEISFWGGVDPHNGVIVEPGHPRHGESVSGRVVLMPGGRGSSSSSSVLAELLRIGRGPAAILLSEPDGILVIGSAVAEALYGSGCPIVLTLVRPAEGELIRVDAGSGEALLEFPSSSADK